MCTHLQNAAKLRARHGSSLPQDLRNCRILLAQLPGGRPKHTTLHCVRNFAKGVNLFRFSKNGNQLEVRLVVYR